MPASRRLLHPLTLAAAAALLAWLLPRPDRGAPSLLEAGLSVRSLPVRTPATEGPPPPLRLDGAFYQPDLSRGFRDPAARQADLRRLADLGGQSLWIQYLAHGEDSLLAPVPGREDPIRGLLDEAHALSMRVWLGTREEPGLWAAREVPLETWKRAGDRGLAIAEVAAARYASHPAFAGWYWTPELVWGSAPGPERLRRLAAISAEHIASLRSLRPGTPVAVALGPGGTLGDEVPSREWCRWIEAVRPDVVVVMDGVGTQHVDVSQLDLLYAAARGCAARVGATMVADVEVFGGAIPPAPRRLELQLEAAWRHGDAVVAFDLPHHLAPGTVASALFSGLRAPLLPTEELRLPADWSGAPELVTLDLLPAGPVLASEIEVVTRWPHPAELTLSLNAGQGWEGQGTLRPHHGPGRDERTARWQVAAPQRVLQARVTLRRGDGAVEVLRASMYGEQEQELP